MKVFEHVTGNVSTRPTIYVFGLTFTKVPYVQLPF